MMRTPIAFGALALLLAGTMTALPLPRLAEPLALPDLSADADAGALLPSSPTTDMAAADPLNVGLGPFGHITIHRFPSASEATGSRWKLLAAPTDAQGWYCRDDVRYAYFRFTTAVDLSGPNPSVTCWPPESDTDLCNQVVAGGYHAKGSGHMFVTSSCSIGPSTTKRIELPLNDPGVSDSASGVGRFPWTCSIDEDGIESEQTETDWWAFCEVNPAG